MRVLEACWQAYRERCKRVSIIVETKMNNQADQESFLAHLNRIDVCRLGKTSSETEV